ncbi:MAG: hypothetical protein WAN75_17910 [Xanthobacteraceae bacterium]|jgi:hypothetical protein
MAQRGRKGGKQPIPTVPVIPGNSTAPPPPKGLTAGERRVWRTITEAMRPDWYNPAFGPVLVAHVREAEAGDALARRLRACAIGSREYTVMAAALRASTKILISTATKLRLTPAANGRRQNIRTEFTGTLPVVKPWLISDNSTGDDAA